MQEPVMPQGIDIAQLRYRAVRGGLLIGTLAAASGVVHVLVTAPGRRLELALMALLTAAGPLLLHRAARARAAGQVARVEWIARLMLALAWLGLCERIVVERYLTGAPAAVLQPLYLLVPLVFVFAHAALPAREAGRWCWAGWAAVAAATAPDLPRAIGAAPGGATTLVVWLLFGLPLMLVWLRHLPHLEDELEFLRSRAELAEALTRSRHRFDLVIDSLQVGAFDRELVNGERRWWSDRFYELIGYRREELPPGEDSLAHITHPDDRDRVRVEIVRQLDRGDRASVELRLCTRHRGWRWFNATVKAERDADGQIVRLAGAIQDIHERRTAEEQLRAARDQLRKLAYRDALTGLHNRRHFNEQLAAELARAGRHRRPLSLLLIDIDHFKAYNDCYGHAAGDHLLVAFARLLREQLMRSSDTVARIGGEEFAVILPETGADAARQVGARLLAGLARAAMRHDAAPRGVVTVSIGIATMAPEGPCDPEVLYARADEALYRAKRGGRNGCVHAEDAHD